MIMKSFGKVLEGITYKKRDGVYAIIQNTEGLIATVNTPRGYFLPGGGIELGESHEKALLREVEEEIGYKSEISEYIGTYSMFVRSATKPIYYELIGNFYICQAIEYLASEVEEDHELIWLSPAEAMQVMQLEYQKYAIEVYLSQVKCDGGLDG